MLLSHSDLTPSSLSQTFLYIVLATQWLLMSSVFPSIRVFSYGSKHCAFPAQGPRVCQSFCWEMLLPQVPAWLSAAHSNGS